MLINFLLNMLQIFLLMRFSIDYFMCNILKVMFCLNIEVFYAPGHIVIEPSVHPDSE
jgi:hypothetical protein